MRVTAYGCCLSTLTRFTGSHCEGPSSEAIFTFRLNWPKWLNYTPLFLLRQRGDRILGPFVNKYQSSEF